MRALEQTLVLKKVMVITLLLNLAAPVFGATSIFQQDMDHEFVVYKGTILDKEEKPIASAYLSVTGTSISTVTNSEGKFTLKVPLEHELNTVTISHLGFESKTLPLVYFKNENVAATLNPSAQELSTVSLFTASNPRALVREMLQKRGDNYYNQTSQMNAFYREAIKKGRRNVSLSEAVVTIHKQPYDSYAKDNITLIKARKSADYERLDTLALKLRGGPFNNLYMDIMKNPEFMFEQMDLDNYEFTFSEPTRINNKYLYVVDFKQKLTSEPWYYGKLYIDAETATLVKASFNLNVDNRREASSMFVKSKPGGTKVYPVEVKYDIEYRERDGKWYFGYGNSQLEFVVNWKRKLFNSRYTVNSEMAITNWQVTPTETNKQQFLNPNVVMADDVSGFSDAGFWGSNNIIEPDKSIETAIEKIQRQLQQ